LALADDDDGHDTGAFLVSRADGFGNVGSRSGLYVVDLKDDVADNQPLVEEGAVLHQFGHHDPGVILTKVDADTRGGAALSVRTVTERPIKFLGVGEKTDALDPFHPDRLASRILGMGDMLSLIEEVERKVDHGKAKKLASKVQKGGRFDLEDFREQLQQMKNIGGMGAMLDKMPGMGGMAQAAQNVDTKQFDRMEAMINSMTPRERRNPDVISGSRKRRITVGSGTAVQDLNRLLKQHKQMQKMMKKMKGGGMQRMMRGLGGMTGGPGGGLPPGFPRR